MRSSHHCPAHSQGDGSVRIDDHAAELAPTGRIVIDAHRRVTREQARVIDALASLLNARGALLPDEHLR